MDENMNMDINENDMNKLFEKAKEVNLRADEASNLDERVRAHITANPVLIHSSIVLPAILAVLAIGSLIYVLSKPSPAVLSPEPKPVVQNEIKTDKATSSPIKKNDTKDENNPNLDPLNNPLGGRINAVPENTPIRSATSSSNGAF